ncbi:hypothetical protein H2200_003345 [Cladophialophora chaetospira]|uniref:Uncharacterized protein n=1 Tax=Cladophialophora chaetospira TaxID=386627 RepID=A0AA38XH62_9EURO|nr:hypothetical protein H2200_003345 [Cladophialophora chaetospira]
MNAPTVECGQFPDLGHAVTRVSADDPEALASPMPASLVIVRFPPSDSGNGSTQPLTGSTAQSRSRDAQDRAAYSLERVKRLQQLQTATQETLDDTEKSLGYITKEVAGFEESKRQKEHLVAECKKVIGDRAQQIKQEEDFLLATQMEIKETEELVRREKSQEDSDAGSKQQAKVVNVAPARTALMLDSMAKMSDGEFYYLLQRACLARNVSSMTDDCRYYAITGTTANTTAATAMANTLTNVTPSDVARTATPQSPEQRAEAVPQACLFPGEDEDWIMNAQGRHSKVKRRIRALEDKAESLGVRNTIMNTQVTDLQNQRIREEKQLERIKKQREAAERRLENALKKVSDKAGPAAPEDTADTLVPTVVGAGVHTVNGGTPRQKRKAIEMESPEHNEPEETEDTNNAKQASISHKQPSNPSNHDNIMTQTPRANKKPKMSLLPAN